jgi:hypothetical protein
MKMHLSTSSSEVVQTHHNHGRFTAALLLTIVFMLLLAEAVSVAGFDRVSKVQRREVLQRNALLTVKDAPIGGIPHVAIVGNSLLLEGVDIPFLAEQMQGKYVPVPYFVLATEYYDWLFGLKRLFASGMSPRYVVLGLSPDQLASSHIRGDYSARYLFQSTDLWSVARQTHMDATTAGGFVIAHFSEYYSTRSVIRRFLLGLAFPSVMELLQKIGNDRAPDLQTSVLGRLVEERLPQLDQLCKQNGAQLVFVVPPTYQSGAETIKERGTDKGVSVLVPVANGEFGPSYFSDGFHLNAKGAKIFTQRLANSLLDELPALTVQSSFVARPQYSTQAGVVRSDQVRKP